VWLGAQTFAPSADGPLVGGRAGAGAVSFFTLRNELAQAKRPVPVKLMMTQPGLDAPRYEKVAVEIVDVVGEGDRERMAEWVAKKARPHEFVPEFQEKHDDALVEHANTSLYPYSQEAARTGVGFAPSHPKIAPIHAPYWVANLPVPGFMFWMQTGITRYNAAMYDFMKTVRDISFARHGIDPQWFVRKVNAQLEKDGDDYDDDVTRCVAAMMSMCAIAAVSTFYRYDEGYVLESQWFGTTYSSEKKSIESFQDALAYAGGDCEDVGSLIHRVFRWLQMGDPENREGSKYWRAYGGWTDPVLDAMQHMAYWYVSGGSLGSVTAARFTPTKGSVPQLLIRSDEDESLPIGGHMWREALPVTKVEKLMRRINPNNVPEGALRPHYDKPYPRWIKRLPHTVGEGTGSVYPLVLPLAMYAHSAQAKARAEEEHAAMISALTKIQEDTKILRAMQIQRYSDRSKPVPDARVNYFYRRTTKFTTDDFFLQGIPRSDCIWTLMGRRNSERGGMGTLIGAGIIGTPIEDAANRLRTWDPEIGIETTGRKTAKEVRRDQELNNDAREYIKVVDTAVGLENLLQAIPKLKPDANAEDWIKDRAYDFAYRGWAFGKKPRAEYHRLLRAINVDTRGMSPVEAYVHATILAPNPGKNLITDLLMVHTPRDIDFWRTFAVKTDDWLDPGTVAPPVDTITDIRMYEFAKDARFVYESLEASPFFGPEFQKPLKTADRKWLDKVVEKIHGFVPGSKVYEVYEAARPIQVLFPNSAEAIKAVLQREETTADLIGGYDDHNLESTTEEEDEALAANPYSSFVGKKKSKKKGKKKGKKEKKKSKKEKKKSKKEKKKSKKKKDTDTDTTEEEEEEEEATVEYFLTGARQIGDIPGEPAPGQLPTWGVNMRDKVLTANLAYEGGKQHNNVALAVAPPVTNEQMALFKERMRHLPPWRQPRRTPQVEQRLRAEFEPYIRDFDASVRGIVKGGGNGGVQVNCIFRRNEFANEKYRLAAVQDVATLSDRSRTGPHVQRVETAFEFIDDDIYNVRVSLWMA
jgi:hypothetical protein